MKERRVLLCNSETVLREADGRSLPLTFSCCADFRYPLMGCLHCNAVHKLRASGLPGLHDGLVRDARIPHLVPSPWRTPIWQHSASARTQQGTGAAQHRRNSGTRQAAVQQQVHTAFREAGSLCASCAFELPNFSVCCAVD